MSPKVSIIITTRNRAEHLRQTLESFRGLVVPKELPAELLIVDNASTDGTADVIKSTRLWQMPVRYLYEPKPGQSNARNSGMANTTGEVILFTDDDVRMTENWIAGMTEPIVFGRGEAVVGSVRIASHLERPWMGRKHRAFLASTSELDMAAPPQLIGANMGFARRVLDKVPGFDPELGPGAMGFGDETLFSWQLKRAGFRLVGVSAVLLEHHFDPSRLLRRAFLESAVKMGRSAVYLDHHWRHATPSDFLRRRLRAAWKLLLYRATNPAAAKDQEGCDEAEIKLVTSVAQHRQWRVERKRRRNYEQFGLVRLAFGNPRPDFFIGSQKPDDQATVKCADPSSRPESQPNR